MDELISEIRKLNKLLILLLTQDKTQASIISMLDKVGFRPKEISDLIGAPKNSVTKEISRNRKNKK